MATSNNKRIDQPTISRQTGTTDTLYAAWVWSNKTDVANTENYEYEWNYSTGDGVWFVGSHSTQETAYRNCTYNYPENAVKVQFRVKPIAKKTKNNGQESPIYTSAWSLFAVFDIVPPQTPPVPQVPTVTIDHYKLIAELDSYDARSRWFEFKVVYNNNAKETSGFVMNVTNHATFKTNITVGRSYKVQARAIYRNEKNKKNEDIPPTENYIAKYPERCSAWSEYSESVGTEPPKAAITQVKLLSTEGGPVAQVHWDKGLFPNVKNSDSFIIEYAISAGYFGSGSSEVSQVTVEGFLAHAEIIGLELNKYWYFRMRAENEAGAGSWSEPVQRFIGSIPSAPTIWSETTTAVAGDPVYLYWIHNSLDESDQTHSDLYLTSHKNGDVTGKRVNAYSSIRPGGFGKNDTLDESEYEFNTSSYSEGDYLTWKVRTVGALQELNDGTHAYGPWSEERVIYFYSQPVISSIRASEDTDFPETISQFPITLYATASPASQTAMSYDLSIAAVESYTVSDIDGEPVYVSAGEEIFHELIPANEMGNTFSYSLDPGMIRLENGQTYEIKLMAAMSSGLVAVTRKSFTVAFDGDGTRDINAIVQYDPDSYIMRVIPYCQDEDGEYDSTLLLSVYRREYDGRFTLIDSDIINGSMQVVVDPHPALDQGRYRIVVMSSVTGIISYYDMPGIPIDEKAIVLQWNETWRSYSAAEDEQVEPDYAGTTLVLPFNIDVSDSYSPDVSLVNYIGRQNPVSYYGTQRGIAATWNTEIVADDVERLYALRKLAIYGGDVYVREPSGVGYWAQVTVSMSKKHGEMVIPVTLSIKRVEGGT